MKISDIDCAIKNGSRFINFSKQEQLCARYIFLGDSSPKIARHMGLSTKTTNTYRYRMFHKLGFESGNYINKKNKDIELVHLIYDEMLKNKGIKL